jgi:hypothetical protein
VRQARRCSATLLVLLAAVALPRPTAAQTAGTAAPSRVEIWGAWATTAPIRSGALESAYEPPLRLGGTPIESRAQQVLTVDADAGFGVDLGASVFFNRVLGVQGAFTATSAGVGGANGDYETYLRYVSRPPPDYQARENTFEQSLPWAPTAGTLGYRSISVSGVVRWRTAAGRVGGTLTGGVDIDWFTGELESLGYTQFILGGHSTLFPVTHRVRIRPSDGEAAMRPCVGGDVHLAITRRVAIMAGIRVRLQSGRTVPIQVVGLVDPGENPWTPEVPEVAAALDGQPLELPGVRWKTFVGVKLLVR